MTVDPSSLVAAVEPDAHVAATAPAVHAKASTYREILSSTLLIGGSSMLNLAINIVRTKAMAVLLGPASFGLMGVFTSIADLARCVAGMGVNSSGVGQVAESMASGDSQRIARTVTVLRRAVLVLGILGAVLLAVFSRQIAILTFGNDEHWNSVALLSLAVLLRLVADGQGALLQGMRRIGDIAKLGVLGALSGAFLSVILIYWLREEGVAPSLVAIAAMSLVCSWWYSRRVHIERPVMTVKNSWPEATALLRLGLTFMTSGLLTLGAAYVVRVILIHHEGLHAAGLYQTAWTLGGIYVGFVLQAMSADFYPRLVAVANDDSQCNRLVNEQAYVSLLLAGTGIIATITFAPWVVTLLYSAEFMAATDVLRWVCLGMALRLVTWPLGYIMLAKGKQALFMGMDLAWTVVNIGLTWVCVNRFGLVGAGVAFFGAYLAHLLLICPIGRRLSGFRWSAANLWTGLVFASVIAMVHAGFHVFSPAVAMTIGAIVMISSAAYSVYVLRGLVGSMGLIRHLKD